MVGPTFEPGPNRGSSGDIAFQGLQQGSSWMGQMQERRMRAQQEADRAEAYKMERAKAIAMLPVEYAKRQADIVTAHATVGLQERKEQLRTQAGAVANTADDEFLSAQKIPDAQQRYNKLTEIRSKYAWLGNLEEYKPFLDAVHDAQGNSFTMVSAQNLADAHLRNTRLQAELTADAQRQKDLGPDSPIGKMIGDYDKARKSGDTEAANWIMAGIKESVTPKGMTLEVGPDGSIRLNQGGGAGLTTTNTTKSQERQYQQERLIREGGQLMNILRPEDLGVQGNVGETAGGFLGQLNPDMANAQIVENRTRLRTFRESALRAVSDDSRFSNQDRKAIEAMLPSDGWVENLPQARGKLKAVMTIFAQRATNEAQRQGKQSWTDLSPEDIVKGAREGKIDKDAAAAILDSLHGDWVKAQSKAK